jgi:hypothetical protein
LPSFPGSVGMFALNFLVGGSGFARNNKKIISKGEPQKKQAR